MCATKLTNPPSRRGGTQPLGAQRREEAGVGEARRDTAGHQGDELRGGEPEVGVQRAQRAFDVRDGVWGWCRFCRGRGRGSGFTGR